MSLDELRAEHETLTRILATHQGEQPPTSEGLRITRQIYLDALTDAAKALGSIIEYMESKRPA